MPSVHFLRDPSRKTVTIQPYRDDESDQEWDKVCLTRIFDQVSEGQHIELSDPTELSVSLESTPDQLTRSELWDALNRTLGRAVTFKRELEGQVARARKSADEASSRNYSSAMAKLRAIGRLFDDLSEVTDDAWTKWAKKAVEYERDHPEDLRWKETIMTMGSNDYISKVRHILCKGALRQSVRQSHPIVAEETAEQALDMLDEARKCSRESHALSIRAEASGIGQRTRWPLISYPKADARRDDIERLWSEDWKVQIENGELKGFRPRALLVVKHSPLDTPHTLEAKYARIGASKAWPESTVLSVADWLREQETDFDSLRRDTSKLCNFEDQLLKSWVTAFQKSLKKFEDQTERLTLHPKQLAQQWDSYRSAHEECDRLKWALADIPHHFGSAHDEIAGKYTELMRMAGKAAEELKALFPESDVELIDKLVATWSAINDPGLFASLTRSRRQLAAARTDLEVCTYKPEQAGSDTGTPAPSEAELEHPRPDNTEWHTAESQQGGAQEEELESGSVGDADDASEIVEDDSERHRQRSARRQARILLWEENVKEEEEALREIMASQASDIGVIHHLLKSEGLGELDCSVVDLIQRIKRRHQCSSAGEGSKGRTEAGPATFRSSNDEEAASVTDGRIDFADGDFADDSVFPVEPMWETVATQSRSVGGISRKWKNTGKGFAQSRKSRLPSHDLENTAEKSLKNWPPKAQPVEPRSISYRPSEWQRFLADMEGAKQ